MTDDEKIIADYRGLLTKTEQEAQSDFDKAVLTLSGGALGLSFAFTKDVVGTENVVHTSYLLAAWIAWGLSSTSILLSFFTSQLALRKAIKQLDAGKLGMERPGGWFDWVTARLNLAGLILFLSGLTVMIIFLCFNVNDHMNLKDLKHKTYGEFAGGLVPPVPPAVKQYAGKSIEPPSNQGLPKIPEGPSIDVSPVNKQTSSPK